MAENGNDKDILARTTIEGLPGTDFNINLQAENFKMDAQFLSDLVADDKLKIRTHFNTRRFYGYSPINLPLYEEDSQKHTLELGSNESIVLLPFGRNGGAETLKIEISPTLLSVAKTAEASRLTINIDKQMPNGEIAIRAVKVPHNFIVTAVLLADGHPIARGGADCLLEEEKEIALLPIPNADSDISGRPFATRLTINKFIRNGPQEMVDFNFNFYRTAEDLAATDQMIISEGAGIGLLSSDLSYSLENIGQSRKGNYELKFTILLGPGESEN